MNDFFDKAIDPNQYDSLEINWQEEGLKESPTRKFIQYYLLPELGVNGKHVIDIGCGMGQMTDHLKEKGAVEIVGIDPSKNNIKIAKQNHSDILFIQSTLQNYQTEKKFDIALAIMIFEHIQDIEVAFSKISRILKERGILYLVVGDKDYSTTPRFGYELEVKNIDQETVAVKTRRGYGTMYDILRPLKSYNLAAGKAGFKIKKHTTICPNDDIIKMSPKYEVFRDMPIMHLFILEK